MSSSDWHLYLAFHRLNRRLVQQTHLLLVLLGQSSTLVPALAVLVHLQQILALHHRRSISRHALVFAQLLQLVQQISLRSLQNVFAQLAALHQIHVPVWILRLIRIHALVAVQLLPLPVVYALQDKPKTWDHALVSVTLHALLTRFRMFRLVNVLLLQHAPHQKF